MDNWITQIEEQLVDSESRMDATDATVSETQIDKDNVRQELYQHHEAFMAQGRELMNR